MKGGEYQKMAVSPRRNGGGAIHKARAGHQRHTLVKVFCAPSFREGRVACQRDITSAHRQRCYVRSNTEEYECALSDFDAASSSIRRYRNRCVQVLRPRNSLRHAVPRQSTPRFHRRVATCSTLHSARPSDDWRRERRVRDPSAQRTQAVGQLQAHGMQRSSTTHMGTGTFHLRIRHPGDGRTVHFNARHCWPGPTSVSPPRVA